MPKAETEGPNWQVKLEFCVAHDVDMSLSGTVRVANICFHKTVFIRYTLNNWKTTERDVSLTLRSFYTFVVRPVYKFILNYLQQI